MKPIVIYLDKNEDEVKLTRKEFEEYIDRAYKAGYDSGYADGKKYYPWWNTSQVISSNSPQPLDIRYTTTTPIYPKPTIVTCEAHNSVGDSITGTTSATVTSMQTKE